MKLLLIITLVLTGSIVCHAGCNRDNLAELKQEWDVVVPGNEVTWKEYAQWTATAVADAFGCSGACTSAVISSILSSVANEVRGQIQTIGMQTVLNLVRTGGTLNVAGSTLKGGILTYDCWIDDCNCCDWNCGQKVLGVNIPCTGCSCQQDEMRLIYSNLTWQSEVNSISIKKSFFHFLKNT